MLEDPAILTIAKKTKRPTKAQIKAFKNVPTGMVVDAMYGGGALASNIRPVGESRDLKSVAVGPALTVQCGAADVLALLSVMDFVQKGDIVVSAFDGFQGCASAGDRVCGLLKNNGAKGLVTDGPVRDYHGIVNVGLPCWATGLTPASPFTSGPGTIGLPVQIGGQQVSSGDMVIADHDGVVIVPFDKIDQTIKTLKKIQNAENKLDKQIEEGLTILPSTKALLKSEKVKYV